MVSRTLTLLVENDNATPVSNWTMRHHHPLEELLSDHSRALITVNGVSLVLGSLLAFNMLWHLQVATSTSGRGVLRIIRSVRLVNVQ